MTPLELVIYFRSMGFKASLNDRSITLRLSNEDITSRDIVDYMDREKWSIVDQIINMRRYNEDSFDYVMLRLK